MKAIHVHAYGGPAVLRLEDVPDPQPGAGAAGHLKRRSCARWATSTGHEPQRSARRRSRTTREANWSERGRTVPTGLLLAPRPRDRAPFFSLENSLLKA